MVRETAQSDLFDRFKCVHPKRTKWRMKQKKSDSTTQSQNMRSWIQVSKQSVKWNKNIDLTDYWCFVIFLSHTLYLTPLHSACLNFVDSPAFFLGQQWNCLPICQKKENWMKSEQRAGSIVSISFTFPIVHPFRLLQIQQSIRTNCVKKCRWSGRRRYIENFHEKWKNQVMHADDDTFKNLLWFYWDRQVVRWWTMTR